MDDDKPSCETACLAISVGQDYHEGNKLKAVVEWVNTHYKSVIIDVADTLQRHNLALEKGVSISKAHEEARKMGDNWIKRNSSTLSLFTIPTRLDRWDERLEHPEYEKTRQVFDALYKDNSWFRKAVGKDARGYIHRRTRRGWNVSKKQAIGSCTKYLLEEIAVLTLFYRENPCETVYPSPPLKCFELVKNGKIKGAPRGLENEEYHQIKFSSGMSNFSPSNQYIGPTHRGFNLNLLCR